MTDQQNVVLITVDSLRADHCGFMGYEKETTPTLDKLAADGLVFENAIAPAPETNSSVSTMLTGQYPNPDFEWGSNLRDRTREHMRAARTLPQRFRERGYETAAFTANPWTSRYFNFDRDFDYFEDTMDDSLTSDFVEKGDRQGFFGEAFKRAANWWQGQDMFMSWDSLYDDIAAWLESADSPYFLWIFLVDVHMPYLPPAEYRSRPRVLSYPANTALFLGNWDLPLQSVFHDVLVQSYDDTIRYTDAFFNRIVADVDDDTLITITADHGELFGEYEVYGHGSQVAEETTHVPLVVANGPNETVDDPFSLRNLPELLPALASGRSYDHLLETTVWSRNYDPAFVVRGKRWRYEWRPESEGVSVRSGESWETIDHPELERLGSELVEACIEGEHERRRIIDAADDVAEATAI